MATICDTKSRFGRGGGGRSVRKNLAAAAASISMVSHHYPVRDRQRGLPEPLRLATQFSRLKFISGVGGSESFAVFRRGYKLFPFALGPIFPLFSLDHHVDDDRGGGCGRRLSDDHFLPPPVPPSSSCFPIPVSWH